MKIGKVWTPNGPQVGPINSLAGKNESIINYNEGTSTYISEGTKGVDDQPTSVSPYDDNVIAGNDKDYIGYNSGKTHKLMSFADQVAPLSISVQAIRNSVKPNKHPELSSLSRRTKELQEQEMQKAVAPYMQKMKEITDRQEAQHEIESRMNAYKANCGKDRVAKFDIGSDIYRQTPAIAGSLAALNQLLYYTGQPISYHSTYAVNPYATEALRKLSQLNDSSYGQLKEARDAERRAAYANEQAGGLSGSQKYTGRIALGLGAMKNAADIYRASKLQNNQYKQQYASAMLQEGNTQAQRRQQAAQHDWADYVAAHGRKTKGMETAVANLLNSINQGYANEFKYNTWRETADMYNQQLDNEQQAALARIEEARALRDAAQDKPVGNVYQSPYLSQRFLTTPTQQYYLPTDYRTFLQSGKRLSYYKKGKCK